MSGENEPVRPGVQPGAEQAAPGPDVEELAALFSAMEPGRRGEILSAALGVFSECGYDSGSMRAIATRVGVTEPALYRHFPGKEAILGALLRMIAMRLRNEILGVLAEFRTETMREQMIAALRGRRQAVDVYGPLLRIVLPVAARDAGLRAEYRRLVIEPVTAAVTEKAAEVDGELGIERADETRASRVRSLLALIAGYIVTSFVIGDEPEGVIVDAALRVMGWDR